MRIGFDVRPLQTAHRGAGIGTYTSNLFKHLLAAGGEEDWVCYARNDVSDDIGISLPAIRTVSRPPGQSRVALWEQLLLPIDIFRGRLDLFHATGGLTQVWDICAPRIQPAPTVVTVQDLHPLILPHFEFIGQARTYQWQLTALKRAAGIIAVSENTKKDIVRLVDVDPDKITVIHMAPGEHFTLMEEDSISQTLKRFDLSPPFMLYVGNYNVHKNIETIVEAWSLTEPAVPLAIVGKKESYPDALKERVDALGRADSLRFLGGLPYDSPDLVALYNAATSFIFPSLYEGFGLPVVEAMNCGCPVIVSNRGSLPEVVGDGGVIVEPEDVEGMAAAMQRIMDDGEWREQLRKSGFENNRRFSWKKTAEETLALYHRICDSQ